MPLLELDRVGCVSCPVSGKATHHLSCCEHRGSILEIKKLLVLECFSPEAEEKTSPVEVDEPLTSEEIRFVEDSEIVSDPFEPVRGDVVVAKPQSKIRVKSSNKTGVGESP